MRVRAWLEAEEVEDVGARSFMIGRWVENRVYCPPCAVLVPMTQGGTFPTSAVG